MATTKEETTRARIANIKTDLQSISTCTTTTVSKLREILADKVQEAAQKENVRVKSSQLLGVQPNSGRRVGGKATTTTVDAAKQAPGSLSPKDRYILATEIANITLKSLADALKSSPISKPSPPLSKSKKLGGVDAHKPAAKITTHARSVSFSQKPLQERSVSQVINSPQKRSGPRRSSSYSSCLTTGPPPGLVATAECARVSFAYLRTPEALKVAGKDTPTLQLENGILALTGKLLAHGLDNLALKELRVLKKRLDHFLGVKTSQEARSTVGTAGGPQNISRATEKETLATLLDFGKVDLKSPALPLVIGHQTYVLRLIATTKHPRVIEATWDSLQLSNPSSLTNLILHAAEAPNAQAKATRQLESLSQTILSLCPSISSSDDPLEGTESFYLSPDVVLRLQHLALQIRQRWWTLAKHEANQEKELFEPFAKCLVAFSRRSRLTAEKKYQLAESLYAGLPKSRDQSPLHESGLPSRALIARCLSSLAQAAGLVDEALRWVDATPSLGAEDSAARTASRLVRIATLSVDACIKDSPKPDLQKNIANATGALAGNLGGSSSELDGLFAEVNSLRRIVSKAISLGSSATPASSLGSLVQGQAIGVVAACMHFLVRFIGAPPTTETDAKAHIRYSGRVLMVAKSLKNTIDSVLACVRLPVDSDDRWIALDHLIQDSTSILQHFEDLSVEEPGRKPILPMDLHCPYVKLSNAYWSLYLQLRKANRSPDAQIEAMRRSIDMLCPRPNAERQSGLLAMKLEKLGENLDAFDHGENSRMAFSQSIQNMLDGGLLRDAAMLAGGLPVRQILDTTGPTGTLGRVLKLHHRSFIKYGILHSDELAFFDRSTLPATERGMLLEWQIELYLKALVRNRPWDTALNGSLRIMGERLLELYTGADFPLRRRRACVLLLELSEIQPDLLSKGMLRIEGESQPARATDTLDHGLLRFEDHIRALLQLKLTMRDDTPSTIIIQECLFTWQTMVDSVSSWKDLTDRMDDPEYWLQQMQAVIDYLTAKGEDYICIPTLRLLVKALELQQNENASRLISCLCALGLHSLRLGYSGKAGMAFAKAETVMAGPSISTDARLQWHLAYAEYLLKIGNFTKCETTLSTAKSIAIDDLEFMSLAKSSATLSGRVRFNKILADACYVHSLLSFTKGSPKDASRYAKRCVALNRRIWAALENKANSKRTAQSDSSETDGEGASKGTFDPLSSIRNEKGIPLVMSVTHEALNGPEFWPIVPSLYRGLMLQSLIYAHQGLLQEAVYTAEQAEKVASATHSQSLLTDNRSHIADYWAQGGRSDKAQSVLDTVDLADGHKHISIIQHYSSVARVHHSNKKSAEELAAYEVLERILKDLTVPTFIKSLDSFSSSVDMMAQQMANVSLSVATEEDTAPVKKTRGRKPTPKAAPKVASRIAPQPSRKAAQQSPLMSTSIVEECEPLNIIRAEVCCRKALQHALEEDLTKATELLDSAQGLAKGEASLLHHLATFKTLLLQSMKELSKDFTYNTLPESTIAFPAIGHSDRKSVEAVMAKRANTVVPPTGKGGRGKKIIKEDFIATLRQARDCLVEIHTFSSQVGSAANFQQVSYALGQVTVLLSAASSGEMRGSLHPLYVAFMGELPKYHALRLCQASIEVEQETPSREEVMKWPELASNHTTPHILASTIDFQKEFIDIIPNSWTAVSLALNEAQDELYVTRYQSGQSPFVLRLPMGRHTSRDMDEEGFSYEDGKRDFDEIIDLSDFSTRTGKDMTSKDAKAQWWDERQALDTRLRELLVNIENIWLGGFKGIFSQHPRQPALLARFRKSFENILGQHLPSRRGKTQQKKTVLDTRVLELFVGLGDATNDELDLDEALMDLVYFVVDILQFNGERNAYDEIDFDAIVVETLDALRAYHNASQAVPTTPTHTVLILDKNLHFLPWESMPCLQSLSISRLPSLAALRDRILAARASKEESDDRPGHYIPASAGGTSILNPSEDLSHTLKTIKPRLDDMDGPWSHIVSRAPSEKEFESALKDKELVLYFGHGSGAQFIRSKSIKKLYMKSSTAEDGRQKPGCATTFLFGCSSAHLTENGIYEPSGMLASYLTAGAPAVLGMLWDVTDKDCDRFAIKAGELWGLWPETKDNVEQHKTAKKSAKGKGKVAQLVAEVETARGAQTGRRGRKAREQVDDDKDEAGSGGNGKRRRVGLDEAVREARDACFLRYLNGAAAVVYGIPVFLE
ncbi:peptidase family C50-domain-containing protein [Clohesyomyces aquaticus]|uniref:separase n=1 Tax=Clohesyomyces aquaticus TaxID=1231657 RepID=A0A1Y1ZEL8_9PLEO|nr:peptidase family C50-domain-containing protein [Clohesyomyces aquaticus]